MKEIRSILSAYHEIDHNKNRCALAVVVRVEGSSYRRAGARMLVVDNGTWTGGISGGCLEGDALRKANLAIYMDRPNIVTYDTRLEDDKQIGIGLGCNGLIDVLFIPINPENKNNAISLLEQITQNREKSILLTVTLGDLNEHYRFGYSWIFDPARESALDGSWQSSILEIVNQNVSQTLTLPNEEGDPVRVFVEVIQPTIQLFICGGNYDIYPLIRIAKEIGWEVHVQAKLSKLKPDTFQKVCRVWEEYVLLDGFDERTAIILMSHDFETDKRNVQRYIHSQASYIGLLGPRVRSEKIIKELADSNIEISPSCERKLHYPTGLDLGSVTPEEIALSICAEIVAFFSGRDAKPLRLRAGKIYG